jgi:hypothetical protein
MVRGTKDFETDGLALFSEESIASTAKVCLGSGALPHPHAQHARHAERGAEPRDEPRVFRRSFAAHTMIEVQDA